MLVVLLSKSHMVLMGIFGQLADIIGFERHYLPFIETIEDRNIAALIGFHDIAGGKPMTLKILFASNVGSMATVHRRVARLVILGVVIKRPHLGDGRSLTLHLSPGCKTQYQRYGVALANGK